MKKIITTLVITSFLFTSGSSCILFNMLGLNPGHEKGVVAAARVQEAAITVDIIRSAAFWGFGVSILSILADKIAGIDPGAYYKSNEVDACVDSIWGVLGFLLSGGLAAAIEDACALEADNMILDP